MRVAPEKGDVLNLERDLNEEQRAAVSHGDGPLLVLAGAGSGKTRVLTYRFAHLVRSGGIHPARVLAVTFTNKAAGEMKERIEALLGSPPLRLWIGTFHSVCARILREVAGRIGVRPNFTIFDEDDQKRLVKTICREEGLDPSAERVDRVLSAIRRIKSRLEAPGDEERGNEEERRKDGEGEALYPLYQAGLERMNAFDFDDLLLYPVRLLRQRPEFLEEFSSRFEHLLVDEFQDTNRIQNELVRLLSTVHGNVCAVGDDDQSIYRWRGAEIGNILRFEESFPGARVIRLERNYRSTKPILEAASAVIRNNQGRRGKALWTDREGGEPLAVREFMTERDEGLHVAREIRTRIARVGNRPADFALFYRTNAQSRSLEEGLRLYSVPYTIVGGTRFYERREVKDVLAYLRVLHNERDEISLERILNVPARGVGEKSRSRLKQHASENGLTLREALGSAADIAGLGKKIREALVGLDSLLRRYARRCGSDTPHEIVRDLVEELRFIDILEEKEGEKGALRGENVKELVSAVAEFEGRRAEATLADFLAEVSLISDMDDWEDEPDLVTLMTLHNSKGLEFNRVYICGVEEGLLPHAFSAGDEEELEEERRLFYVGLTRARDQVTLTNAATRIRFGEVAPALPSRFLREIPPECLEDGTKPEEEESGGEGVFPDYENESQEVEEEFRKGDRVLHGTWGEGRVTAVEGRGPGTKLSIAFQVGMTKKVMVRFADLKRLPHRPKRA